MARAEGPASLPSGIAGALSGTIPLFSFVAAALFLRSERVTAVRLLGVGLSFVYARRFLSGLPIPAAALTTYQMGFGLLILLTVTSFDGITEIGSDTRASIALVVGLGLMGTGVAYILYYFIVRELGAVTASDTTYIPPVVALAIGWLAVGEPLLWWDAVAVLAILAGVVIIRFGSRPSPAASD